MENIEKIRQSVFRAITEVNLQLPKARRLLPSTDQNLMQGGAIESLALVNLIAAVEQEIDQAFGKSIDLLGDSALVEDPNILKNVGTLCSHVGLLLGSHG